MNNDITIINETEARRLLNDFFDGLTTIEQEQLLYNWYRTSEEIPADLQRYGVMLGWLEQGMPRHRRHTLPRRLLWSYGLSAAAMVAIVIGLGFSYSGRVTELYNQYEGSYVVKNGHRMTNLRTIMPDLQRAESLADASFSSINEPALQRDVFNTLDSDMQKAIDEILDF